jgi:hypothetical protein
MSIFESRLGVVLGAILLVFGATFVQGMWTERWTGRRVGEELNRAAKLLESRFPKTFGDWEYERELESSAAELQRAGAVGHVSRLYRNKRTKARISAFVVCARPHDASGHTPDRCYPGAGFTIGEPEHRETIPLQGGGAAETFTGTFVKSDHALRVFWTYGVLGNPAAAEQVDAALQSADARRWIAPGIARIALNSEASVYKLYAIADQTRLTSAQAMVECKDFLSSLLPALNASFASGGAEPPPAGGDAAAPGGDAGADREAAAHAA